MECVISDTYFSLDDVVTNSHSSGSLYGVLKSPRKCCTTPDAGLAFSSNIIQAIYHSHYLKEIHCFVFWISTLPATYLVAFHLSPCDTPQ